MFWFKKNKIVLDCFTADSFAFEYCRISKATDHYPDWWQELPGSKSIIFDGNVTPTIIPTTKHCRGLIDLYKKSFMLPMWGNILLNIGNIKDQTFDWSCDYNVACSSKPVVHHLTEQVEGFLSKPFQHIKLASPWLLNTNKKYVGFLMHDSLWNKNDPTNYNVLPGVLDFKYQASSNINLIAEFRNESRSIHLRPSDPIAMLTPIIDGEVDIRCHLVHESDIEKYSMQQRIFFPTSHNEHMKYPTVKKFINKHDERSKPQSKCPFGFGK